MISTPVPASGLFELSSLQRVTDGNSIYPKSLGLKPGNFRFAQI